MVLRWIRGTIVTIAGCVSAGVILKVYDDFSVRVIDKVSLVLAIPVLMSL